MSRRPSVIAPGRTIAALVIWAAATATASSASETNAKSPPRWTISAEAVLLGRVGTGNQPLVAFVPGDVYWWTPSGLNTTNYPGAVALASNQLGQRLAPGPKLGVTYRGASGWSAELSYFSVVGLGATRTRGPENPGQWLVMKAPGSFWQTQDFAYQSMAWRADSGLHSLEANVRRDVSPRVTLFAGLRWLQLNDTLQGTLTPIDIGEPDWKTTVMPATLADAKPMAGSTPVANPPFWTTDTGNSLYGVQIGARATVWQHARFSVEALAKAGVYANHAEQAALVSIRKQLNPASAAVNTTSFVGEGGLVARFGVTDAVAFKLGYDILWLNGVALAPTQIAQMSTTPTTVTATGVDTGASTLFQGLSFGVEYTF
ncbi:hypothetical protein [Polymorphobacter arshaanensis]|uniref:hypothetical protein n=1 Tax=Glacieibacterium arshaanense TaxID=2511025 RepID=UPI001A9C6E86|nr:hypothetical protein [Polymorphobacter arshaanensis]